MIKLSSFSGQEHITSVLRASIIKGQPILKVAVCGDEALAQEIRQAYWQSLRCQQPVRGDACGECYACTGFYFCDIDLDFRTQPFDGSMNFQTLSASGTHVNPDVLRLVMYAHKGSRDDVLNAVRKLAVELAVELDYQRFLQQLTDIFVNILYIKGNVEIKEINALDAMRALGAQIPLQAVYACIRTVWDAQLRTMLDDKSSIEVVSLLLANILNPEPEKHVITAGLDDTPIRTIEVYSQEQEQHLTLDEMLTLARE